MWQSYPSSRDGMVAGRNLIVTAEHTALWHSQPVTSSFISLQSQWEDVNDMSVTFTVPEDRSLRIMYSMMAVPETAPNVDVLTLPDYISTRVMLDGTMGFRER